MTAEAALRCSTSPTIVGGASIRPGTGDALNRVLGTGWDLIVSLEVIEHLFAPRRFVAEMFDLLRPGGVFIVTTAYHGYFKNLAVCWSATRSRGGFARRSRVCICTRGVAVGPSADGRGGRLHWDGHDLGWGGGGAVRAVELSPPLRGQ